MFAFDEFGPFFTIGRVGPCGGRLLRGQGMIFHPIAVCVRCEALRQYYDWEVSSMDHLRVGNKLFWPTAVSSISRPNSTAPNSGGSIGGANTT